MCGNRLYKRDIITCSNSVTFREIRAWHWTEFIPVMEEGEARFMACDYLIQNRQLSQVVNALDQNIGKITQNVVDKN